MSWGSLIGCTMQNCAQEACLCAKPLGMSLLRWWPAFRCCLCHIYTENKIGFKFLMLTCLKIFFKEISGFIEFSPFFFFYLYWLSLWSLLFSFHAIVFFFKYCLVYIPKVLLHVLIFTWFKQFSILCSILISPIAIEKYIIYFLIFWRCFHRSHLFMWKCVFCGFNYSNFIRIFP